jgi:acyl carrier protein
LISNEREREARVQQVLLQVLDELNRQLPRAQKLPASLDTVLAGPGGKLDSLGLINFIVSAEERLSAELGVQVALTDDSLGPEVQKTFGTLRSVAEHVCRLMAADA